MLDRIDRKAKKRQVFEAFAHRLNEACDAAGIPPFKQGRQSYFKDRLNVSAEAVRRWFAGESLPRQEMLVAIAAALKVDPSWLAYGDRDRPKGQTAVTVEESAAANYVAGLMQLGGAAVAFTPNGPGAFTAIRRGVQANVFVAQASAIKGGLVLEVPHEFEGLFVVGVVAEPEHVHAVVVDHDVIAGAQMRNAMRRVEIEVTKKGVAAGGSILRPLTIAGIAAGIGG